MLDKDCICKNCKYIKKADCMYIRQEHFLCCYNPPSYKGFPQIFEDDCCGKFKFHEHPPKLNYKEFFELHKSIECLNLTIRTENTLKGENIYLIEELIALTDCQLLKLPNIGKRSVFEIKKVLTEKGLKLANN